MKPIVSVGNAWSCIVISIFAILILSVLGGLFRANHHSMMDSTDDPKDGPAVAGTAFAAVGVYGFFLVFCGLQAWLHHREGRRGVIALS